jgi:hypothetical protein
MMVRLDPSVRSRNPTRLFRKNTPSLPDGQSATRNCPAEATYWPGDRSLTNYGDSIEAAAFGRVRCAGIGKGMVVARPRMLMPGQRRQRSDHQPSSSELVFRLEVQGINGHFSKVLSTLAWTVWGERLQSFMSSIIRWRKGGHTTWRGSHSQTS